MKKIILFISLFSVLFNVQAAIPQKPLLNHGFIAGGEANSGVTITSIKKIEMGVFGVERYSLDFGDRQGKPLIGKPGYFHVELKNKPRPSLVINIAKVVDNQVDKAKLQDLIKKSQFLSNAELLQSNEDGSQTFTFNIKQNTPVKVFQVKSKKGASKMIFEVGQKSRVR